MVMPDVLGDLKLLWSDDFRQSLLNKSAVGALFNESHQPAMISLDLFWSVEENSCQHFLLILFYSTVFAQAVSNKMCQSFCKTYFVHDCFLALLLIMAVVIYQIIK